MKTENIKQALQSIGVYAYANNSSYPDSNAQSALEGKTHYVDADTLKYFKSRILMSCACKNGFYFILQESLPHPDHEMKRVRRNVLFDVFGRTVDDERIRDITYTSSDKAEKAYYELKAWMDSDEAVNLAYMTVSNKLDKQKRDIEFAIGLLSAVAA